MGARSRKTPTVIGIVAAHERRRRAPAAGPRATNRGGPRARSTDCFSRTTGGGGSPTSIFLDCFSVSVRVVQEFPSVVQESRPERRNPDMKPSGLRYFGGRAAHGPPAPRKKTCPAALHGRGMDGHRDGNRRRYSPGAEDVGSLAIGSASRGAPPRPATAPTRARNSRSIAAKLVRGWST